MCQNKELETKSLPSLMKLAWHEGLPVIEGRFGCPDRIELASFYSVLARGQSMYDLLFNDYVEPVVLPATAVS